MCPTSGSGHGKNETKENLAIMNIVFRRSCKRIMVIQGMEFWFPASPQLVCPLGKYSWKKSDFCQFFKIEERGASEVWKIKFLKTKGIKISKHNSNFLVKTIRTFRFKFLNWWTMILTRANLEIGPTQNSKFSMFDSTSWFHLFFWLKNTPYLNFRFKNDLFALDFIAFWGPPLLDFGKLTEITLLPWTFT